MLKKDFIFLGGRGGGGGVGGKDEISNWARGRRGLGCGKWHYLLKKVILIAHDWIIQKLDV